MVIIPEENQDINLNYAVIKSRDSYIQVVIDGVSRGQRQGSSATMLASPTQNTSMWSSQILWLRYVEFFRGDKRCGIIIVLYSE